MRFVPPVAGALHGRRSPSTATRTCAARPVGEMLTALRDPRRGRRRRRPRRAAVHGRTAPASCAAAGSSSTPPRPRSSSRRCCWPARATTQGVDVRHDGKPVPSLPHIEMTVAMLRDARGRGRRRGAPTAGRSPRARSAPSTRPSSRTCPTPRRSWPLAAVSGGTRRRARLAARARPRPGDALRDILARMGCEVGARPTTASRVTGTGTPARHRPRPARRRRADAGGRRAVRAGRRRRPTCAASPTSAATRPTGSPRWPPSSARSAPTSTERADGLTIAPGPAARRRVPHLRRPPDGPRRRDRRRGRRRRPGRGHRHHRQDVPRLRRRLDGAAVHGPPRDAAATASTTTSTTSGPGAAPGRAPRTGPTLRRRRRRRRGHRRPRPLHRCSSTARRVTGDEVAPAGPQGRRRRRPGPAWSATPPATTARWPGSSRSPSGATVLRRTADDDDPVERVIVANADQLVVVDRARRPRAAAAADRPGPGRGVRRRAWQPLLCLTKADLADPETLLSTYRSLGVPWVVTQRGRRPGRAARAAAPAGPACWSGTAASASPRWSTRWCPDADRDVGHVNAVTGRGRHTSTSAPACWRCPTAAAGSSTPRASAPSGWPTCGPST